MATAPLTTAQARIISLSEADLKGLEALFDEQCVEWAELFKWDYRGPSRLIRDVARQRQLLGFAATSAGAVVGSAFYVIEAGRCSIGDIYVTKKWRGTGVDHQLVAAMLDKLAAAPRLRRVESQCVNVGIEGASDAFLSRGFCRFIRHYMMLESGAAWMDQAAGSNDRACLLDVAFRAWKDSDFDPAASVIHRSYQDEHDRLINAQYRSQRGCAELLGVLTEHIWCGDFLPDVSQVAVSQKTGQLIAVLVALRVGEKSGHIGQISVVPEYQGVGIGRRLINAALAGFQRRGYEAVSLAVTATNTRALRLYQSCGFRTIHTFPVFYHQR